MGPLISIVIPVYNVAKYLECCLDSVVGQTYTNLEIILVDDGSTDLSGNICDRYANQDARVNVIHKENGGLSQARNSGIEIAKGDFISFVDSDDYLSPDFIEVLYLYLERNKADFSMCCYYKFHGEKCDIPKSSEIAVHVLTKDEAQKEFLGMRYPMYAHGKLFGASLFNQIRFPEGRLYEDVPTVWNVLKKIDKIVIVNKTMYFYRQRKGSIVSMEFSTRRLDQNIFAEDIYNEVQNDTKLEQAAAVRCFFSALDNYALVPENMQKEKKWVEEQLRKYSKRMKNNSYAGVKMKFLAVLAQCSMGMLHVIVRIYKRSE